MADVVRLSSTGTLRGHRNSGEFRYTIETLASSGTPSKLWRVPVRVIQTLASSITPSYNAAMIKKLTIFGVGLIGGSLALALKKANFCAEIVGCSRDANHLQTAVDLGVIDSFELDPVAAVRDANVVFLSVPMRAMETVMTSFKDGLSPTAIITDGGSSKASVVAAAAKVFGEVPARFVPAHPIAGREKSGVQAAFDSLYVDHKVILTPLESTDAAAIETVTEMWQATGAVVAKLGVEQHDQVLAATSHLPHVVAYALVDTLASDHLRRRDISVCCGRIS